MQLSRKVLASIALLTSMAGLAFTAVPAADDFTGDAYPLDTCPVSGEKLGDDAVSVVLSGMKDKNLDGTHMKFCCKKCEAAFKADPAKFMPKVEEKLIAQAGNYPLGTCLVMTDEGIDASSKTVVYHNRVYKLCCKKCVNRFTKDPAKWAKEYETAVIKAQKPAYKATTCPISGKPLGEGAVDVVIGNRLVRVCCAGCVGPVKADTKAAFAKIDAAK